MDIIDRSVTPDVHAAARRHRAVYLSCLFTNLRSRVLGLFLSGTPRTVACG